MKLIRLLAVAFALAAVHVQADTLRLDSGSGVDDGHFGVGPLQGTLTLGNAAPFALTMFCVDFNHEVNFGATWDVSVTSVHSLQGIYSPPNTPGSFSAETFYRAETFLAYTMFLGVSNNQTLIDIQHAVWNFSRPGAFTDAGALQWQNFALAHIHDASFEGIYHSATLISQIQTGHGPNVTIGPGQEMITFNSVPEPGVVTMGVVGLLGLVGLKGWRRRRTA